MLAAKIALFRSPHTPDSLPGFKGASCATAGPLLELNGIDCAFEIFDTFDDGTGRALGLSASNRESPIDFVGIPSSDISLEALESEFAASRRDVDITRLTNDGIRRHRNLILSRDNGPLPLEQARHGAPIEGSERGSLGGDHRC